MTAFDKSRRNFLKASAVTGGGLMFGFSLHAPPTGAANAATLAPNAFLEISADNSVTFHCPRDEMGQGVDTGLGTLIAEDLDVEPARLDIRRPSVRKEFINPDIGIQGTGGSTSIKVHYQQLRQVAADVRALLLDAAAQDLGTERASLSTADGHVLTSGGERYPYSRFLATAARLEVPEGTPLKPASAFKYIGKDFPRLDGLAKSTGTAQYSIDVDIPGMHYAVVVRCPVAGGTLKSMKADAARDMPGVTDVVEISAGAAVVAEHFWQARKAATKLEIEWNLPALAGVDTARVRSDFEAALANDDGVTTASEGEPGEGFARADTVIDNHYWTPFLAHAPLEPMNAVVKFENGKAEVWSGTQGPVGDQGLVARALGISKDDVTVHPTYMGGAFGRRGTLTHVVEAAEIAQATSKPIQVLWTREDDLRHGVYRPASLMRIKAGVDSDGVISAWQATRVGGNMLPTTLSNQLPAILPGFVPQGMINFAVAAANKAVSDWTVDHGSIEGLYEDYDLANREVLHITVDHGLPLTYWRSVGHSYTAFAKETMMDELAEQSGIDAVDLRLRNTRENPRLANVIRIAGEQMKSMRPAAGRALGLAAHGSFHSHVAEIAEVSVERGNIRVHRVTCVVDCGRAINPDIIRAQMEGAVMFGLTAALHGNLELKDGAIVESNFHNYPILRMDEAPDVDVIIVDSEEPPTGVGEPGLPPVAPAVANAVYAATGQRLHSLPLKLA